MLDGHVLVDAHVHVPVLGSVAPAWVDWARQFGPQGILEDVWDGDGVPRPARLDEVFAAGDITDYPGKVRLISVGFGEAATAVNNAAVHLDPAAHIFPGHTSNDPHDVPVPA